MNEPIALAEAYARAFHAGEAQVLREIFLPDCKLQFVEDSDLKSFDASAWIDIVENRPSQASQGRPLDFRLVSMHMAGPNCAAVAIEMAGEEGVRFSDLLHMLRVDGMWKIVAKSFDILPMNQVSAYA